mgnify:CR=1 FL=1
MAHKGNRSKSRRNRRAHRPSSSGYTLRGAEERPRERCAGIFASVWTAITSAMGMRDFSKRVRGRNKRQKES